MRLLRLLFWGGLAYLIYSMLQQEKQRRSGGRRELAEALNRDRGRAALSGGGRGHIEASEDETTGMEVPNIVGRGVVHPQTE